MYSAFIWANSVARSLWFTSTRLTIFILVALFFVYDSTNNTTNEEQTSQNNHPNSSGLNFVCIVRNVAKCLKEVTLISGKSIFKIVNWDVLAHKRCQVRKWKGLHGAWLISLVRVFIVTEEHYHRWEFINTLHESTIWLHIDVKFRVTTCMHISLSLNFDVESLSILLGGIDTVSTIVTLLKERHVESKANIIAIRPFTLVKMKVKTWVRNLFSTLVVVIFNFDGTIIVYWYWVLLLVRWELNTIWNSVKKHWVSIRNCTIRLLRSWRVVSAIPDWNQFINVGLTIV